MATSLALLHFVYAGYYLTFSSWSNVSLVTLVGFVGFISDYLALLKTRAILMIGNRYPAFFILCLDGISSIAISFVFFELWSMIPSRGLPHPDFYQLNPVAEFQTLFPSKTFSEFEMFVQLFNLSAVLYSAFYFSTLFTSIWLALIVLSSTFIKLLAPLHRFTAWFFDVEKHPLEAVGIVGGAMVLLGAAIWTVVQKF
jgi:hypothetical protein